MTRITSSVTHKKRVKKVIRQAKGYYGKRKNIYSIAKQSVVRSGMYAFAHRRKKKGDFRRIWQVRINAILGELKLPSYSRFIHLLKLKDIRLDRKSLAFLSVNDPSAIKKIYEVASAEATLNSHELLTPQPKSISTTEK